MVKPVRKNPNKNPPIFSHEFIIQNHADIVSCVAMVFVVGLMVQATAPIASIFVTLHHNVTEAGEVSIYTPGVKDWGAVFFYSLICIVIHAIMQEYVLDKISKRLHLSKSKLVAFNTSGQLAIFYLFSTVWGLDIILRERFLPEISLVWSNYPQQLSFLMKLYVIIQLAYSLHELPELYFQRVKREEYLEKVVLSIGGVVLISIPYFLSFTRLLLCLLVLHYGSELVLHVSQLIQAVDKDERFTRATGLISKVILVICRLGSIMLSVLTLWFGMAQGQQQELDVQAGYFNVPAIRIGILGGILGLQVYLTFNFINQELAQIARNKESKGMMVVSKSRQQKKDKNKKQKKSVIEESDLPEVDQNTNKNLRKQKVKRCATNDGNGQKKKYGCDLCDYRSNKSGTVKMHMLTHTDEKPCKCDVCDFRCKHPARLKTHMAVHSGDKPFKCVICDYRCVRATNLKSHMVIHDDEKPFKCHLCDYECNHTASYKAHMLSHTGVKAFKCDCCDYKSRWVKGSKVHLLTHSDCQPLECGVCGYKCKHYDRLKQHMLTHVGKKLKLPAGIKIRRIGNDRRSKESKEKTPQGPKLSESGLRIRKVARANPPKKLLGDVLQVTRTNYICVMCGLSFSNFGALDAHMKSATPCKVTVARCPACGKTFKTKSRLTSHMAVHREKPRFPCGKCGRSFANDVALQAHVITLHTAYFDATLEDFACKTCGERAPSKTAVLQHINTKHMHVTTFLCDVCGKCFLHENGLKAHAMTHSDSKPFVCQVCSKSFKMSTALKAHLRTHSPEKSFVCDECGKAFKKKCSLVDHKRYHAGEFRHKCNVCFKQFVSKSVYNSHVKSHLVDNFPCL